MEGFDEVYKKYLSEVYRFLLKICGNQDLAEELTQSTFVIAFEQMEKFRGTCKISVWLCQIAKHEYFAHIRRQRRFVEEDAIAHEKTPISVEDEVIDQTEAVRIQKILSTLPEPYREVFTLRVLGELGFADISKSYRKSESWARVTYYRAKKMIAERLGGETDESM